MSGPDAAVAAVRVAVRRSLADLPAGARVLVACSGGADSLALAAAAQFEARAAAWQVGAVTVDHGLQEGSTDRAQALAATLRAHGLDPVVVHSVVVGTSGGPEAAARTARYAALEAAAAEHGADAVLLGHTRDDQAETVLLGLLRGSGTRAASGMAGVRGRYRRPFLDLSRATTRQACAEAGLTPWEDPHNDDEAYTRVRVRQLLGALRAKDLDLTDGLARSARLLREDADALDALTTPTDEVAELLVMAPALRSRALKAWAEQQCGQALASAHVDALKTLVEDWRGQGPVALPGGGVVAREGGRLAFWT